MKNKNSWMYIITVYITVNGFEKLVFNVHTNKATTQISKHLILGSQSNATRSQKLNKYQKKTIQLFQRKTIFFPWKDMLTCTSFSCQTTEKIIK